MPEKPNPPPAPPPPRDEDQGITEAWHRRLAWGIPTVALLLGIVGVLAVLGPPFKSPGQGVRKIAPELPSAAPTPAPAPAQTSRPCGAPGALPNDYEPRRLLSLGLACADAGGRLIQWASEDGLTEPQCWRVGESEPVPLGWHAGP
jgi:hypothetical protein